MTQIASGAYIDKPKCNTVPGSFGWSKTQKSKSARKEALKEELAATTLVTPERKAAVTLSNAYNWHEWTYASDDAIEENERD